MTSDLRPDSPSAPPGARAHPDWLSWAEVVGQVGLMVYLAGHFRLENRGVYHVLALAWAAFIVHLLLPGRWRLPFFGLASVATLMVVLGIPVASWIVGLGTLLILLCHVPLPLRSRAVLLLLVGSVLAVARVSQFPGSDAVPALVWPILGSMFMFRIATYLWSVSHANAPLGPAHAAAYFFMLPNAAFPLFPVVDYQTWSRSWYDADALAIAQRGVGWMARGVVHLLLYRLVYHRLVLDPSALVGMRDLLQFLLATFLLYLRVSGMFHLVVGLLHLFGFHLPETHRLYFFSSSITDFWRRINIYWKDFMMKLVYFPSFFALRRFGQRPAMILATVAVFVATWALHAYQWFWLLGERLLNAPDMLFWGLLGGLAVGNSLWEARRGLRRTIRPHQGWSLGLGTRRLATFAILCLLWSLWTSESVAEWVALFRDTHADPEGVLVLLVFMILWVAVAGFPWGAADLGRKPGERASGSVRLRTSGVLAGLALLSLPAVGRRMPGAARPLVGALGKAGPNAVDAARQHRGYYEDLANGPRLGMPVWYATLVARPADWEPLPPEVLRSSGDFLVEELTPGTRFEFQDAKLTINRWGMRDRERELVKSPGTFRIALLGASDLFGLGVGDGETMAAVLERLLNAPFPAAEPPRFEVLSFAVSGYSLLQQLAQLEWKVLQFQPDVVMMSTHYQENWLLARHLTGVLRNGHPIPYPEVEEFVRRTGVAPSTPDRKAERLVSGRAKALFRWALQRAAATSHEAGARPVLLLLRMPTDQDSPPAAVRRAASAAGFQVIDLARAYPLAREEDLRIAPWDNHPNAAGHRHLAERLRDELVRLALVPSLHDARPPSQPLGPRER